MMILSPGPVANVSEGAGNLLTPSPKEVWAPGNQYPHVLAVDLGQAVTFDTIFLGFTNGTWNSEWKITGGVTEAGLVLAQSTARAPDAVSGRPHMLALLAQPVTYDYLRIYIYQGGGASFEAGAFMYGLRNAWPHERGGGRQLIDTGTKEQLPDGGLGGEDGIIKAALKWRFTGLTDAARRKLWAMARSRGERKPVVVIEDPDSEAAGADERIHYGTFDRFDAFERRDPNDTAWSMSMTEWV